MTQEDNIRVVSKQSIMDDIYNKQALSDFSPVKKIVDEYPEDEVMIVYDYDFQYDKNFYICLSTSLKEIINMVI